MTQPYFLTCATKLQSSASEFGYPTVESALLTADAVLGKRLDPVWIVDKEGNLFLPTDQVGLRLPPRAAAPTLP